MISYNHEKYIGQAINGVLMQQGDFELELLIANDCSPDGTDQVVSEIIASHPKTGSIRYVKHMKNLGMMSNFIFALQACQGDYIAICEGDDFWTDPQKLQKQLQFLKNNPDCVLCFHNATVFFEESQHSRPFVSKYQKTLYTGHDILKEWLIPTASMFFVNVLKQVKLPDFFAKAMHGDLALQLFLYEQGNMGLIDQDMCTYRINQTGATRTLFHEIAYKHAHIAQLKAMKHYFGGKYDYHFNKVLVEQYRSLIKQYRGTHIIGQFRLLYKMATAEPGAISKYRSDIYASAKIILRNILSATKVKTT